MQRSSVAPKPSTTSLLRSFDTAWLQYLEQFVAWKSADAASLEVGLLRRQSDTPLH